MQANEEAEDAGYTEIQQVRGSKRQRDLISEAGTSGLCVSLEDFVFREDFYPVLADEVGP
jgi:hypothetical protein